MLKLELEKRNIPELRAPSGKWDENRQAEVLDVLTKNVFGRRPPAPVKTEFIENNTQDLGFALFKKVRAVCWLADFKAGDKFEFDISCYLPKITAGEKIPAIAALHYRESFDYSGLPVQDITAQNVAVFAFRYRHIVNDYPERGKERHFPEFDNIGIDKLYYGDYRLRDNPSARKGDEPGTITFWSWGASCVMDYIQTLDYINLEKVAVSGFSRLGKTALFTGACDTRFTHVLANASCASGAALTRGVTKEDLKYMANAFPEWFCDNLKLCCDNPPFDMHFLLVCIAPRKLYIANADNDPYCDPNSEYLSCVAAAKHIKAWG